MAFGTNHRPFTLTFRYAASGIAFAPRCEPAALRPQRPGSRLAPSSVSSFATAVPYKYGTVRYGTVLCAGGPQISRTEPLAAALQLLRAGRRSTCCLSGQHIFTAPDSVRCSSQPSLALLCRPPAERILNNCQPRPGRVVRASGAYFNPSETQDFFFPPE